MVNNFHGMVQEMSSESVILFYDGDCPLCNRVVTFVLNHEKKPNILFSALGSEASTNWRKAHPESLMDEDSVYFYDGKTLYNRSSAVLKILPHLKWYIQILRIGWMLPKALRDRCYDFVALRRKKWLKECAVDTRLLGRLLS